MAHGSTAEYDQRATALVIAERSLTPEPTRSRNDDAPLTDQQVSRWRTEGYALVSDLLPPALIAEVAADGANHFPPPGSSESSRVRGFGSAVVFPAESGAFNQVTLHPRLLAAVSQLLDQPIADLRLTQSDLWAKYGRSGPSAGRYDNQDQRIHIDYPNHTLVHPAPWDRPEAAEIIIYYSHIDDCGGPTAVVPRRGPDDSLYRWPIVDSPGIGELPWINDRESAESYLADTRPELAEFRRQLYEREHLVDFRPGTVLLYRHDTWHRGTPLAPAASDWLRTSRSGGPNAKG